MSGVYEDQLVGSGRTAALRLTAAGLLALSAALAVAGSFATHFVYRVDNGVGEPSVQSGTAWSTTSTEVAPEGLAQAAAPVGIPLVVAALLALVAAVLLVVSARRPVDPVAARVLGAVAGGMVVGGVAVIWIQLLTMARNAAANTAAISERARVGGGVRMSLELGAGAYLLLVAALLAIAAAGVLLADARKRTAAGQAT